MSSKALNSYRNILHKIWIVHMFVTMQMMFVPSQKMATGGNVNLAVC